MGAEQSRAHRGSLDHLQGMGFSQEQAVVALQAAHGDLQRAVQLLLDQPQSPPVAHSLPPSAAVQRAEEAAALQRALEESRREAARARPPPKPTAPQAHALLAAEARMRSANQRPVPNASGFTAATQRSSSCAVARHSAPPRVLPQAPVGGSPEERVQQCAQMISGNAQVVDILITSLSRALEHPNEEKYRTVNPSNPTFKRTVGAQPGGIEFLWAVGYENVHGHLVLQNRDAALLWLGKSALEALRSSATYQASKEAAQLDQAIQLSGKEFEEADAKRRAAWLQRVPAEPADGAAGSTLICFHVGGAQVWRRFESCNTLEDLTCFARSLPKTPVRGLTLENVTMSPAKPLDIEKQKGLTLQYLDMWPTAHVRVGCAENI